MVSQLMIGETSYLATAGIVGTSFKGWYVWVLCFYRRRWVRWVRWVRCWVVLMGWGSLVLLFTPEQKGLRE